MKMKYLKMALLGAMLGNSVTHADNHSAIKLEKDEGDKISVKIKNSSINLDPQTQQSRMWSHALISSKKKVFKVTILLPQSMT